MTAYWLPGATKVDYSANHGYGPFKQAFLGVIAHVNQGSTTDAFFAASTNVCPNFQVYADGSIHQYLPLNWQPWCQTAGNQQYAAIESAGWNTDPWTDAQLESVALILAAYRDEMGLSMQLADAPGQRGFGWHGMGGNAWGGHPFCPGEPRKAQRAQALTLAAGLSPSGGGTPIGGFSVTDSANITEILTILKSGEVGSFLANMNVHIDNAAAAAAAAVEAKIPPAADPAVFAAAVVAALPAASGGSGEVDLQPVLDAINELPADVVAAIKAAL